MKNVVLALSILGGILAANHAANAQSCKVCAEQRAACMKSYAGPTCKSEYQMCIKSCKNEERLI